MDQPYRYERHLTSGDEIRLIQLKAGGGRFPLRAKILYRHLSKVPEYQALSYTWGSPFNEDHPSWRRHPDHEAQFNLYTSEGIIGIGESLHGALIRLREPFDTVTVWVDAICIQQSHDQEKAWQIQHIREIYEKASRVVIWLGPADATSDTAMSALQSQYRHYLYSQPYATLHSVRVNLPRPTNQQEFEDQLTSASFGTLFGMTIESEVPIPKYPIEAVANLLNRAYWGRGWCWQEFAVAKQVEIWCGKKVLKEGDLAVHIFMATWDRLKDELRTTPYGLDHRPWSMMELRRSYRNIAYLKSLNFVDDPTIVAPEQRMLPVWAHHNPGMTDMGKAWLYRECIGRLSMKELLEESSNSWLETAQKEDQIFALIGIASDANELDLKVDYTVPWEEVYTQLAVAYVDRKELWFLNYCQATPSVRSSNLPSWVPDWSQGYRGARLIHHYTPPKDHLGTIEGKDQPKPQVIEPHGRLQLRGIIVDEIEWVSSERFAMSVNQLETYHRRSLYRWIREVAAQCRPPSRRSIWTVMIAGSTILPLPQEYHDNYTKAEMQTILDDAFDSILERYEVEDERLRAVVQSYLRCFMQATGWKCIFRTKKGYLGLAHSWIKKGDHVAVFMGVNTAFVIRPVAVVSPDTPRYHILGETYVHELMESQGLKASAVVEDLVLE